MPTIRIPRQMLKRLEKLARKKGLTVGFRIREAISNHIEDLEDFYLAERALRRIQSGKDRAIPLEEVLIRYGIKG